VAGQGGKKHDPVAVEFAKIMAVGGVIGVTASLVIATGLAKLAGLPWTTAFVSSAWPALVGGPFFGVAFGMVPRFARMDTMDTMGPARHAAEPEAHTAPAATAAGHVAFGEGQG
jgi:hypothetical protein